MLTPSQYGDACTPRKCKQAIHNAIKAGRIKPKPKMVKIGNRVFPLIAENATLEPPRKPGPKKRTP